MPAMTLIYWLMRNWLDHLGTFEVRQGLFSLVYSGEVLVLDSWRKFNRWWLYFDMIQDLLDEVQVINIGNNPHGAAANWA